MHRSTHPDTSRRWVDYLRTFQEFETWFGDEPASSVPILRLNRRRSNARGLLFHRLAQQAVALGPAPYRQIRLLAAFDVEGVVDAIERAIPVPQAEIIMHGATRRQVFGQIAPLAAGAEDVHHAVHHLAHDDPPLAAASLAGRDERLHERPFLVGQIAWITQPVAIVAGAIFGRPHAAPRKRIGATQGITKDSRPSSPRSS